MEEPDHRYNIAEREIMHRIRSGRWPYGAKLPARELVAAEIGIGIRTTRRALKALCDPDRPGGPVLRVLDGNGTYVIWREEQDR